MLVEVVVVVVEVEDEDEVSAESAEDDDGAVPRRRLKGPIKQPYQAALSLDR